MKIIILIKEKPLCGCGCGLTIPNQNIKRLSKDLLKQLNETSLTIKSYRHIIAEIRLE